MSAPDANSAVTQLSRQGLRLKSIMEGVAPAIVVNPVQPRPLQINAAAQQPSVRQPVQQRHFDARQSRRATYNDRQFFFAQLAALLRTGISPADALHTILSRGSSGKFRDAVNDMARMCAGGSSLADAMEHYPEMFSRGIVGAVRAGEAGGYLPDACDAVSKQQKETRTVFWFFFALLLFFPLFVVGVLFAIAMAQGVNRGIDAVRDGNTEPVFSQGLSESLNSFGYPVFGALLVLGLAAYFIGRTPAFRAFRHRIGLAVPPFRWRAYNENLAHFSYHLGRLAKAGLSPFASWRLAAAAVPNEQYAKRLDEIANGMNEHTRLSELMYRAKLFPQETAHLVSTGELTGDLPQALDQVMELGRQREKMAVTYIGVKAGCWTLFVLLVGPLIIVCIVYLTYLTGVFRVLE